ncbi:MAG: glycosyltransferase family 2 protein [Chitinophagales bacterium]|nr:glycosyltransferase family 2 protein [Chitinophagales bacterium]HNI44023.1 glycosyltransferase family A protein [Chitinophagales bacterium]
MPIPQLSIVICTYNRQKYIGYCLESLYQQTLAKEVFEVLVINNNCTDQTESICMAFKKQHTDWQFRYFVEQRQGLSFARNRGIAESRGEMVCFIDDDAVAEPDFALNLLNFMLQKPDAIGVGGRVLPRYEQSEPEWMNPYLEGMVSKRDLGDKIQLFKGGRGGYPVGCNMTYRKKALQKVGGFNEKLLARADDKDIYMRLLPISNQIYYLPTAVVHHHIDHARVTHEGFVRLSRKIGSEEHIRARTEGIFATTLLGESYKLLGSLVLAAKYALQGQSTKGKYIFLCKYYTMLGLLEGR